MKISNNNLVTIFLSAYLWNTNVINDIKVQDHIISVYFIVCQQSVYSDEYI